MGQAKINNRGRTDIMPASKAFIITPNDSNDQLSSVLPNAQTASSKSFMVYVATAGDVSVILTDDTTPITFPAVAAGTLLPCLVTRVRASLTTSTTLIGLY